MTIREATRDDIPGIARVHVDSWRATYRGIVPDSFLDSQTYESRAAGWQNEFPSTESGSFLYVAEVAGEIVGFARGGPARQSLPGFDGELYSIHVAPGHKGKGLGSALLRAVARRLRERGFATMMLWMFRDNTPARRFYESHGGEVVGDKTFEIEGETMYDVAYGWRDITTLLSGEEQKERVMDSTNNRLREVDDYIQGLFPPDEALLHALATSELEGLPQINVSPNEGRLLYVIALMSGARRILEIGTLGGFSTINLARALPEGGRLISLEYSPKHAEVARGNIERAGLGDRVDVRVGPALDSLAEIERRGEGPFDLFFIDADKITYPAYLERAIRLSRPGSVILADNVIRRIIIPPADDREGQAIADFNRRLAEDPRLESIILPIMRETVDGLSIAVVR